MQQIIYLEVDDDITTIRNRLEWAQAPRVLLVIPRDCKSLHRALDFKLLRRHVDALGIEVALVSKDPVVQDLAYEHKFSIFTTTKRGQRARWRKVDEDDLPRPPSRPRPRRLMWPALEDNPSFRRNLKIARQVLASGVFIFIVGILLAVAYLIIPGARIVLMPASEVVSVTVPLTVSPAVETVDATQLLLPAQAIEARVEDRAHIPTTGTKDAPDAPATGTVVFINRSATSVTVPKGTAVSTSAGTPIRFLTLEDVTLPPTMGSIGRVGVQAAEPGLIGNVGVNLINRVEGPVAVKVRVTNDEPTGGGTVKQVGMVTPADKERLRALLLQQLQQKAYAAMTAELDEDEFVPVESLQVEIILVENYDKFVEEEAETLGLEMRASISGLIIDETDALPLVQEVLRSQLRSGFDLLPETCRLQLGQVTGVREEDRAVQFIVEGTGVMAARMDIPIIQEAIRGRTPEFALDYLRTNVPLRAEPQVDLSPEWLPVKRIPWLPLRINVVVQTRE
ncbi:MAG: baseplate J/gp47 family protein [Chloroflexota bacterium]|nr:baseplate J/gp47 family protein [Chloroflexota bacterium]